MNDLISDKLKITTSLDMLKTDLSKRFEFV